MTRGEGERERRGGGEKEREREGGGRERESGCNCKRATLNNETCYVKTHFNREKKRSRFFVCLFVWFLNVLVNY